MSKGTHSGRVRAGIFVVALGLSGCLAQSGTTSSDSKIERRCSAPAGVSGDPRSIYEAMLLVNALPKPLSITCFLQALDRPFLIQATSSPLSAQPAQGPGSPRIFLFRGGLFMAVVPTNAATTELEFGEFAGYGSTVKGSIFFPILGPVATSLPYATVRVGSGTSCGNCHGAEVRMNDDATHTDAYISNLVTPDPSKEVGIASVASLARTCNPRLEPQRCAILSAIVGGGDVSRGSF